MDKNKVSKLKALSDVASIDTILEFDKILQGILEITCKAMRAHSGTIILIDEKDNEPRMVASCGLPDDYIERVCDAAKRAGVRLTSGPSGIVLKTGKYHLVPNIFKEPGERPWYDLSKELKYSSRILTPLKRGSKVIGLLIVHMAEPHRFKGKEIDFVTVAASQAAFVIQNAWMHSKPEGNVPAFKDKDEEINGQHMRSYDAAKYLRTIIDSSLNGIAVVNEHGIFEFGNDSFFNIIGWPREEIIGSPFVKILPEDVRGYCCNMWHEVQKGIGNHFETKVVTKSGYVRHVYISHAQAEINGEKKVVSIVEDISKNKKLELNLEESEVRYKELFENANDGIYTHDIKGCFTTVNESMLEILGCVRDEVIGTHFSRWLTPESLKISQKALEKACSGKPVEYPLTLEVIRKDGEPRWIEIKARSIKDRNRIIGVHGIVRDITEKRKLEQELKESEARYRDLFENANDSFYTFDSNGYFTEVNNTAVKLLRCTKKDIIGTHISEWITPESLKISQELLEKQMAGEPITEPHVVEAISRKGEHQWMEIKRRVIKEGGRLIEVHGIGRDITEKRRLEQEMIESEARYRDLFENADEPMFTLDAEGNFVALNHAGLSRLGCTEEEVIGTHISRWLTPESLKIALNSMKKRVLGEPVIPPTVAEVICKSGEHRWVELKSRVLRKGDKVTGFHGIARDITEKRELERKLKGYHEQLELSYKELKEAETRYRDLFENADDPMYTLDTEGYFQTINNAGLKTLGCTNDEIIGTHISKWLTPESLKISQEALMKQISGDPLEHPIILEIICKNGEHRWGEIRSRCIQEGNRITGIHGIARDITEKKRLEQQLKESETRYKDLFENADDPMYTIDTKGYFQTINNAGQMVLGGTKDDIIGSHISRWLTPESLVVANERIRRHALNTALEEPAVYELICMNGEHRWVEIRTRAIKDGDRITGIHGIARDITEKKRMEQKLKDYHEKLKKSYEELIEADRIKTEFVSNITHELLTPLTSIKGFAELLYDGTTGKNDDEHKKSLEIILRNSERLTRLIKDLLDIAHLEKNQFGLQFGLISMNDIVSKTAQDMQPQAKDKQIDILLDTKPLPQIWGDEERLTQVITNLLANAIKFTPQKGTITITTAESVNEVKISIIDTGIGIPSDKLPRIFDRFYQIDGSTSRKYGGIGLGLSICKSIVESHYGSIWAESDEGGSIFNIVLPKLAFIRKPGS